MEKSGNSPLEREASEMPQTSSGNSGSKKEMTIGQVKKERGEMLFKGKVGGRGGVRGRE